MASLSTAVSLLVMITTLVKAENEGEMTMPKPVPAAPIPVENRGPDPLQSIQTMDSSNMSKRRFEFNPFINMFPWEYRTISGIGNNKENLHWGSAKSLMVRRCPAAYGGDGSGDQPSGEDRPNVRYISTYLMAQDKPKPNSKMVTDLVWQWGQFIDHDCVETPTMDPKIALDIPIPDGDKHFSGHMRMDRSKFEIINGQWEQVNEITSYIDGSAVYGSDEERAHELRMHDGSGMMKTSDSKCGPLLPYNEKKLANADTPHLPKTKFFLAGDVRSNEQTNLAVMHTLFVREHNYWAHQIKTADPNLSGDEIWEMAKVVVTAEIQKITYDDWLPILCGYIPLYSGYKKEINPGIQNEFAACAYRVGHTMLSPDVTRMGKCDTKIPEGSMKLKDAFFAPGKLTEFCLEPYIRGQCNQQSQEIDEKVIHDVQNMLFHNVSDHGFDLVALNLQRGRDHGLPGYNGFREKYGLQKIPNWDTFPENEDGVKQKLMHLYPSIDDCDAWVCMLCEKHSPGAMVGETMKAIIMDQFVAIRDGDRFWYESYLSKELLVMIKHTTLADIIKRNTRLGHHTIQNNVFLLPGHYGH